MHGVAFGKPVGIVGQHPLQEFPRIGAGHAENGAVGEERGLAMAHRPSFCYQGTPDAMKLLKRGMPRK